MDKIVVGLLISLSLAIVFMRTRYGRPERLVMFILAVSLPAWLYLFWL